ncbi:MAG: FAD:protein FMN transferase [Myxococcales bacterium]|nr:FAD:protein FMN transferase [Myxococcales bacterium]
MLELFQLNRIVWQRAFWLTLGVWGCLPTSAAIAQSNRQLDVPIEAGQFEATRSTGGMQCAIRIASQATATSMATAANKATVDRALDEMERVLRDLAFLSRTNQIHSINANADRDEVVVDGETAALLQRAVDVCRRTGGAYDPTVATFDYLWNFSHQPFVVPLPAELQSRKAIAGCKHLVVKQNNIIRLLQRGMRVSLRSIARGYALDRAAQILRAGNLLDFRVIADRQVYVQGRTGTRHWYAVAPNARINDQALGQLYLSSHAAITRTDSDSFAIKLGQRYHDVIDPRSAQPAQGVIQATVISADPAVAAMLAEALFVLGPRAGMAMLAKERSVEGFVVDAKGKVFATKGIGDFARLPTKMDLLPQAAEPVGKK